MSRKRDAQGNIIYSEADRIYNERRRAKRRLERAKRDLGKQRGDLSSSEQRRMEANIERIEMQIERSYKKVNPEGYKAVVRQLKRESDIDFQARENVRVERQLRKEFRKVQKAGFADDYNEDVYVAARQGGAEWFDSARTGERINVATGEILSKEESEEVRERYQREVREEQNRHTWESTELTPIDLPRPVEETLGFDYERTMNSLFNLGMKYAHKQKEGAEPDIGLAEQIITENERRTFFAMIQPFRAAHPDIDPKELYNAILNYINVNDPSVRGTIDNYFQMMRYVLDPNSNWKSIMARGYDEWQDDVEWVDEFDDAHYTDIAMQMASVAQRVRVLRAGSGS